MASNKATSNANGNNHINNQANSSATQKPKGPQRIVLTVNGRCPPPPQPKPQQFPRRHLQRMVLTVNGRRPPPPQPRPQVPVAPQYQQAQQLPTPPQSPRDTVRKASPSLPVSHGDRLRKIADHHAKINKAGKVLFRLDPRLSRWVYNKPRNASAAVNITPTPNLKPGKKLLSLGSDAKIWVYDV